ncbi:MAG TPA: FG-GAP repeat protein [Blastocatellia bacterium]|nr:FG-GAP repeat protein [Blastocatellia bacterium]
MLDNKAAKALFRFLLIALIASMFACARPEQPKVEEPPASAIQPPPQPAPAQVAQAIKPPGSAEVQSKVKEVFKGAVISDANPGRSVVAGDFNGDGSQDIAVVVRPVETMIEEINGEFASWMLGDPLTAALPPPVMMVQNASVGPPPVRIGKGDVLLAIIHGYGVDGWRNPEATQAYLLKNVPGDNMRLRPAAEVLNEDASNRRLPPVQGDVLSQTIGSHSGFLYFTGAKYAWYAPQLYKTKEPLRRVH